MELQGNQVCGLQVSQEPPPLKTQVDWTPNYQLLHCPPHGLGLDCQF